MVKQIKDKTGTWNTTDGTSLLNERQIKFNAKCIVKYFKQLRKYSNWTDNAICGLFGNMVRESHVDPRCVGSNSAYGLIQWDPKSSLKSLTRKCGVANQYDMMYGQCRAIDYDSKYNASGKWISISSSAFYIPPQYRDITYKQFAQSNQSVEWCTECFYYCYEKAGVPALSERLQWANWLKNSGLLDGSSPTIDDTSIEDFVNWLLMIANDNEYTYSQDYNHWNPPIWDSYLTYKYFDCSSFVSYGLYNGGGYDIPRVFTTRTQREELVEFGFNAIDFKSKKQLRKGDILLTDGHTEVVSFVSKNEIKLVGAHMHYPDNPNDDISEKNYYDYNWHTIIRPYENGTVDRKPKKNKGMIYLPPLRFY